MNNRNENKIKIAKKYNNIEMQCQNSWNNKILL